MIPHKEKNVFVLVLMGFPGGSVVKNPPANAGVTGLTPGSGRPLGGGKWQPLQYSYLGNLMDRGGYCTAGLQSTGLQRVSQT